MNCSGEVVTVGWVVAVVRVGQIVRRMRKIRIRASPSPFRCGAAKSGTSDASNNSEVLAGTGFTSTSQPAHFLGTVLNI